MKTKKVGAHTQTKWTQFMDMYSGGGRKEKYGCIYIEAPEDEAKIIFYNRFGHNPERVTCTCCGEDYSITESESIEQATGYERNCGFKGNKYIEKPRRKDKPLMTIEEYSKQENVLFIYTKDIKPNERIGDVPEQGYVWR